MNLVDQLRDRAKADPGRLALVDPSGGRVRRVTYGELWGRVCGASRAIGEAGLGRGDAVLLFQGVSLELYVFLLGALHGGRVCVFVDPQASPGFLAGCVEQMPVAGYFGGWRAQVLRWMRAPLRRVRVSWVSGGVWPGCREIGGVGREFDPVEADSGAAALVTFTSGSTGAPKGAVRTHGFLLAQHEALAGALALREGEVDLVTLPVFALANLASGVVSVLADGDLRRPGEVDAARIARQCGAEGVTRCAASPAFVRRMLGSGARLRAIYTGGAPVFPSLMEAVRREGLAERVIAVYGSTEAEPIAEFAEEAMGPEVRRRVAEGGGLPAGRPVDAVRLAILPDAWGTPIGAMAREEFEAKRLGPMEVGEIVVAGPHVLPGYLGGRGDLETKFRVADEVWHRTGDAGYVDRDGKLWLCGRCGAKAQVGERVWYPFQVEGMLDGMEGVERSALVGGAGVVAVEARSGEAAERVQEVLAGTGLAVERVDRIPLDRRHQAKVDYPRLAARMGRREGIRAR
jgi:acyl-CoA synthetase (AMP-forming)/AMP-acid ligase II